ncbi:MAG: hypothetical protein HY698_18275 [Deltaproteobacteria bacterium]|nr:hypothetical protein [Deltaproteobacteria bacterium]
MRIRSSAPLASLVFLLACGPDPRPHDGSDGATWHPPDASTAKADARLPRKDSGAARYVMWAHSKSTLYAIDPETFTLTTVGNFANGDNITDLAVTPDGTVYGISAAKLYVVDRETGKASYSADVPGKTNVGMTFLPDGSLLAADSEGGVRRINPTSGLVNELGAFGGAYATAGDLVAVADGTMYAISDKGPHGDEFENNLLLVVNPASGKVTKEVGGIGFGQVFGCAYANGHVYAFTNAGQLIEIDRTTGEGTLRKTYPGIEFWGAGVSPLVPPVE